MSKKILLSASSGSPGPLTSFRNHQAILKPSVQCDIVPLAELTVPINLIKCKKFCYRICRKLKIVSVEKIIPYGENVIFGNFGPTSEVIINKLNRAGIRPSFMWCSTLGQIELTPCERKPFMLLIKLLRQGRIKHLFLSRRLYDSIGYFINGAKFLPYSIDLTPYENIKKRDMIGVNIDLFCRPRFGKNIVNQIAAFEMAETSGVLHINFGTKQLQGLVKMISSNIVQHAWLPINDYFSLIAGMNLSLQVTIGESFNYAVCERMCLGVPVLTTKDIYLVAGDHLLEKYLCAEASDTPQVIAKLITNIIAEKNLRKEIAERCKLRIAEVAKENNKIVVEQILEIFR
jgi:glycosyltransferase involved in cell wall biosynthesis